jgi:hypothetical protein
MEKLCVRTNRRRLGSDRSSRGTYEIVEVGDGEGAVPGEGVAVGGGDAKGGGGARVGAEEDGAWGRVALRLGLAYDGAERVLQVYRRRHLANRPDGDEERRRRGRRGKLFFFSSSGFDSTRKSLRNSALKAYS